MRRAIAVIAGILTAFVAALAAAIVLAIVDLYLTGHNLPSLTAPVILGASAADVILLLVAAVAGLGVGWALWTGRTGTDRAGRRRDRAG